MEEKEAQGKEEKQRGLSQVILAVLIVIIIGLALFFFFTRGIYIEGTLVDAVKGTPVAGATVTVGTYSTTSDESGRFKLKVPKLEGELLVNAPGYELLSTTVERNLSLSLVPLPENVASYWFNYWKENNYEGMYSLLTNDCKNAISREALQEEFSRYKMEIVDVRTQKLKMEGNTADIEADVEINTPLGKQTLHFSLKLLKEGGIWKVVWYGEGRGITPAQPPS